MSAVCRPPYLCTCNSYRAIQSHHTFGGRWKAAQDGGAAGAVANLTLKDRHGEVIEKQLPGGKVKKKAKNEVVLETNTRSKKKCVTTILGAAGRPSSLTHMMYYVWPIDCVHIIRVPACSAPHGFPWLVRPRMLSEHRCIFSWSPAGLETFGVKLPEAAKLFGKKFASGASITKSPMEKDQIEVGCRFA